MIQRRALSTVVTGLVALVAILGTTVYFMSGSVSMFQQSNESFNQQNSLPSNQDSEVASDSMEEKNVPTTSTQAIKISNVHSWVASDSMLQECQNLGIDLSECNENTILAKKRLLYASGTSYTSAFSITALVVQNTGSTDLNILSISLRGMSVPQENWYSCGPSCGIPANVNTKLVPDYDPENGVILASGLTAFTAGPVSLDSGQTTILYLKSAGSLQPIDAGNTYSLQVQAGQATAVQQVQVISTG